MCGSAALALATSFGISDCTALVTSSDIESLVARYRPSFESISIVERGVDELGYPSFGATATLAEDHFLEVHSTAHAKKCGVDYESFLKAKGSRATLKPTLKSGAEVTFRGSVLLPKPGDIRPAGWRSPNGVSAGLNLMDIRIDGESVLIHGKPASKIRRFDEAIIVDTLEFQELCAEAKALNPK